MRIPYPTSAHCKDRVHRYFFDNFDAVLLLLPILEGGLSATVDLNGATSATNTSFGQVLYVLCFSLSPEFTCCALTVHGLLPTLNIFS